MVSGVHFQLSSTYRLWKLQQKLRSFPQRPYSDLECTSSEAKLATMNSRAWTVVAVLLISCAGALAEDDQPAEDFKYYQIWASQDGETHFAKCTMQGFNLSVYAALPQYQRSDFGGDLLKMVFTELPVGFAQELHSPPAVQFVVTLLGSWYIETTDGTRHESRKGDVMFQDNTITSPAAKQPQHYSGTVGDEPCHQLVVQISRPPEVDNPCPF